MAAAAAAGCALIAALAMPYVSHLAHNKFDGHASSQLTAKEGESSDAGVKSKGDDLEAATERESASNLIEQTDAKTSSGNTQPKESSQLKEGAQSKGSGWSSDSPSSMKSRAISFFWCLSGYVTHGVDVDVHKCIEEDPVIAKARISVMILPHMLTPLIDLPVVRSMPMLRSFHPRSSSFSPTSKSSLPAASCLPMALARSGTCQGLWERSSTLSTMALFTRLSNPSRG